MVYFLTHHFDGNTPSGKEQLKRLQLFASQQEPAQIVVLTAQDDLVEQAKNANLQSGSLITVMDAIRTPLKGDKSHAYTVSDVLKQNDYRTEVSGSTIQFFSGQRLKCEVSSFDAEPDTDLTTRPVQTITFFGNSGKKHQTDVYDVQGDRLKTLYFQADGQKRLVIYFQVDGAPLAVFNYDGFGELKHVSVMGLEDESLEFTNWREFINYALTYLSKSHPGKMLVDQPSQVLPLLQNGSFIPVVRNQADATAIKTVVESSDQKLDLEAFIADPGAPFAATLAQLGKVVPIAAKQDQQTKENVKAWQDREPGRVAMVLDDQSLDVFEQLLSTLSLVKVKDTDVKLDLFFHNHDQSLDQRLQPLIDQLGLSALLQIQEQPLEDSGELGQVMAFIVPDLGNLRDRELLSALEQGTPILTLSDAASQILSDAVNGELGIIKLSHQVFDAVATILKLLAEQSWWQKVSDHAVAASKPLQGLTNWELWKTVLS